MISDLGALILLLSLFGSLLHVFRPFWSSPRTWDGRLREAIQNHDRRKREDGLWEFNLGFTMSLLLAEHNAPSCLALYFARGEIASCRFEFRRQTNVSKDSLENFSSSRNARQENLYRVLPMHPSIYQYITLSRVCKCIGLLQEYVRENRRRHAAKRRFNIPTCKKTAAKTTAGRRSLVRSARRIAKSSLTILLRPPRSSKRPRESAPRV